MIYPEKACEMRVEVPLPKIDFDAFGAAWRRDKNYVQHIQLRVEVPLPIKRIRCKKRLEK